MRQEVFFLFWIIKKINSYISLSYMLYIRINLKEKEITRQTLY